MLILPIKKKWIDMIKSGEKKEEYREIKPYWTSRFTHNLRKTVFNTYVGHVIFRNGYSKNSPRIKCCVEIIKGTGNPEWGAEKRKRVLYIRDIGGMQMITKEEIEKAKAFMVFYKNYCLNKETANMKDYETVNDEEFVYKNIETILKYIEQLENKVREVEAQRNELATELSENEDDKQKLIDKLKEKIKYFEECDELIASSNDNYSDGTVTYRLIKEFTEILSIAKGENKR